MRGHDGQDTGFQLSAGLRLTGVSSDRPYSEQTLIFGVEPVAVPAALQLIQHTIL